MPPSPRNVYIEGGLIALACAPITLTLLIFSICAMRGKCCNWQVRQSVANLTIPGKQFKFFCFRTKTRIFVQLLLISLAASTLNSIGEALVRIPAYSRNSEFAALSCVVVSHFNKVTYAIAKLSLFRYLYLRGKSLYHDGISEVADHAQIFKWIVYFSACAALSCYLASTLISPPSVDILMNCSEPHDHTLFLCWVVLNWLTCGVLSVFFFRPLIHSLKVTNSETSNVISRALVENAVVGIIMLIITPCLQIIFQYFAMHQNVSVANILSVVAGSFDVTVSCVLQFYSSRKIWKRSNPRVRNKAARSRLLSPRHKNTDIPLAERISKRGSGTNPSSAGLTPNGSKAESSTDSPRNSKDEMLQKTLDTSSEEKLQNLQNTETREENSIGSSSDRLSV
jgi:hypothetical protein